MKRVAHVAMIALILTTAMSAAADAKKDYDALYGEDAKKVAGKDNLAFSARLVNDSLKLKDEPAMLAYMLDKATEYFTRGSSGEDKNRVGEALAFQQLTVGDARYLDDNLADALHFYQQACQTAAAIKSDKLNDAQLRCKLAQGRNDAEKKTTDLETHLAAKPTDAASAKALVKIYTVELDNPAKAAPWLAAAADDKTAGFVKLAEGKPQDVPVASAMDLAQWYKGLAAEATSPGGKTIAQARAKVYFQRYLDGYDKHDMTLLAAKKAVDDIDKDLDKLPAVAKPAGLAGGAAKANPTTAPVLLIADELRAIENLGTRQILISGFPDFSNSRTYWDFKKDGVLIETRISSFARRGGDASGESQDIRARGCKWEMKDKKLVVELDAHETITFPLPITGDSFEGDYASKFTNSSTTGKRTLKKVADGVAEDLVKKLLALTKTRTKVPGLWKDEGFFGEGTGWQWMFCDDGTVVRHLRDDTHGRNVEDFVTGAWQFKDRQLTVQIESTNYTFAYPPTANGLQGKIRFSFVTATGPSSHDEPVKLIPIKE